MVISYIDTYGTAAGDACHVIFEVSSLPNGSEKTGVRTAAFKFLFASRCVVRVFAGDRERSPVKTPQRPDEIRLTIAAPCAILATLLLFDNLAFAYLGFASAA